MRADVAGALRHGPKSSGSGRPRRSGAAEAGLGVHVAERHAAVRHEVGVAAVPPGPAALLVGDDDARLVAHLVAPALGLADAEAVVPPALHVLGARGGAGRADLDLEAAHHALVAADQDAPDVEPAGVRPVVEDRRALRERVRRVDLLSRGEAELTLRAAGAEARQPVRQPAHRHGQRAGGREGVHAGALRVVPIEVPRPGDERVGVVVEEGLGLGARAVERHEDEAEAERESELEAVSHGSLHRRPGVRDAPWRVVVGAFRLLPIRLSGLGL